MATATKSYDTNGATLRLSKDEANTLTVILSNVGGSPSESPRKHAAAVRTALIGAGFVAATAPEYKLAGTGSLYFSDYPATEVLKEGKLYLAGDGKVYKYVRDLYSVKGGYFMEPGGSILAKTIAHDVPRRPLKMLEPKAITA